MLGPVANAEETGGPGDRVARVLPWSEWTGAHMLGGPLESCRLAAKPQQPPAFQAEWEPQRALGKRYPGLGTLAASFPTFPPGACCPRSPAW